MARLSHVVIPDVPHHVTQRGNRRLPVFFSDKDRVEYLQLLADAAQASQTDCLAWCLMDNHVHLILTPSSAAALRATLGEAHRRYTRMINFRGALRQAQEARASFPRSVCQLSNGRGAFDGGGALCRAQCSPEPVEGPVAANLVERAEDYRWSSAGSHIAGERTEDDPLTDLLAFTDIAPNWSAMLRHGLEAGAATMEGEAIAQTIEARLRTGRPLAAEDWIARQEERLGRRLRPRKRGPKPKAVSQR